MANNRGKAIDNTHLSIDLAEKRGIRHRDYYAHMFRWAYVARWLQAKGHYKDSFILDVGCGVDLPLAKMLYSNKLIPAQYIGVEYNATEKLDTQFFSRGKFPLNVFGGIDFASDAVAIEGADLVIRPPDSSTNHQVVFELPSVITSFEVIEHVEPAHCRAILSKIRDIARLSDAEYQGRSQIFISTPCYDKTVGAAGNHVSEITRDALGALLEDLGFEIVHSYGTFASQKDYKELFFEEYPGVGRKIWEKLNAYYDSNVISNIFAPLYPEYSRNNIWHLQVGPDAKYQRQFPPLSEVKGPWTSSDKWEELNGK